MSFVMKCYSILRHLNGNDIKFHVFLGEEDEFVNVLKNSSLFSGKNNNIIFRVSYLEELLI